MATLEKVLVPDIGDLEEVDVVEVLVAAGDSVAREDSLISLESDKATMDVPAPSAGVVREVKVKVGDKVKEGSLILTLEAAPEDGKEGKKRSAAEPTESATDSAEQPSSKRPEPLPAEPPPAASEPSTQAKRPAPEPAERASAPADEPSPAPAPEVPRPSAPADDAAFVRAYASPAVRRLARELGVDLSRVRGSGRKARILKEDVKAFVKQTLSEVAAGGGGAALPQVPVIDFSRFGEIERQPLTRIQKISGPRLQASWINLPHVTQHDEADITEMEAFRQKHSAEAKEQGFSLTPLAFVMKAAVAALEKFPKVNSSLDPDGEHLIFKKYFHLGIAVDTPDGLVVPVIRDVDRKGIFELAAELREVSTQTRDGKLKPDQLRGASFTITSLGGIGGTAFTPIVNAPEVAILGVSRSRMTPVWQDGDFAPRLILPVALSYDHRVVDGALAVRFTTYLCEILSDIRRLLL